MSLPTPSPAAYLPAATVSPSLVMTPASTDDSHAKESYFIYGPPSPPPLLTPAQGLEQDRRASPQPSTKRAKWAAAVSSAADWNAVQLVWWAALPLVLYLVALILALVVLFGTAEYYSFMSVTQNSGNGRLDYYVLNSCAISPGTTQRYCESPAIRADFLPSLTRISDYLPGLSSVKLPFFSHQTTAIFVSATVLLAASFAVYLPLWTLAYFPRARVLPKPVVRFVRYHARRLFDLAGILVFVSFILHVTIGLGYQLYLIGFRDDFKRWLQFGAYSIGAAKVDWVARLGNGFQLVWVGCACEALLVIAVKVSLHNGLDERVEWPAGGDSKEQY
ncbi:hypothetical protein RHOSPDRAFT_31643 [Rhodotorula sp. JG-1b]|nr:hypothetical protein RHOSPDRAFT_31643 [Rhodotorula sp. JG-1b]